jgi:hypothetical protein
MSTLRGADEVTVMDTTLAEGHGQEEMGRDGDQYNICMDMNESTTIQKEEDDTIVKQVSAQSRGAIGVDRGKRTEKQRRGNEEGIATGHIGGGEGDPVPHTSGDTTPERNTRQKRPKKTHRAKYIPPARENTK